MIYSDLLTYYDLLIYDYFGFTRDLQIYKRFALDLRIYCWFIDLYRFTDLQWFSVYKRITNDLLIYNRFMHHLAIYFNDFEWFTNLQWFTDDL